MSFTGSCSELLVPSLQHFFWLVEHLRGGAWVGEAGHQEGHLEVTPGLGSSLLPGLLWAVTGLPPCLSPLNDVCTQIVLKVGAKGAFPP